MRRDKLHTATVKMAGKSMTRIHEIPPERAGLTKALRAAYRVPANDVPPDFQRLLDALA